MCVYDVTTKALEDLFTHCKENFYDADPTLNQRFMFAGMLYNPILYYVYYVFNFHVYAFCVGTDLSGQHLTSKDGLRTKRI